MCDYFATITDACGGNLTASVTPQYFSTPFYPQPYPDNAQCTWIITATVNQRISMTFLDFEIETHYDVVHVSS